MAGVSIQIDVHDLDDAIARIGRIDDLDTGELMSSLGALGESQTRRRISDEKTAPDGSPWAPNRSGGPILEQTGQHLLQSIAWTSSATQAEWGASWEHAHVHQEGATIVPKNAQALVFEAGGATVFAKKVTIPARPFVGISADNAEEITDFVTDFLGGLFK